jgi:hypothetical protein
MNEPRYQIETSNHLCTLCGKEIPCGAHYFSAVLFEENAFRRRNLCTLCWEGAEGQQASRECFAFWKTRRPEAPGAEPRRLRFDAGLIFDFFRRLSPAEDAPPPAGEPRDLRFFLALLLIRKKLLAFESAVERDGSEWLKLSEKDAPERLYWVENPRLDDAELERVRDALGELLGMQI